MATAVRELNYTQAVNEAIRQEMRRDSNVIVIGEDISGAAGRKHLGFGDGWMYATATAGLFDEFGEDRVIDYTNRRDGVRRGRRRWRDDGSATNSHAGLHRPHRLLLRSDRQSGGEDALHDGGPGGYAARHPHGLRVTRHQRPELWWRGGCSAFPNTVFCTGAHFGF